VMCV